MVSVTERTDEELMKQYITGNPTAFEELALRYEKLILNFAYPYFRNIPQSEDIVQEVFVRVVESKDKYNPDKPFKPWIYQIARNRIYDELRRKKRWSLRMFQSKDTDELSRKAGTVPDPTLSPRETLNQEELGTIVMEGIQALDERSKDLVILRHIQGLSVREVAEVLDLAEGTVHSGTHRALATLQKILIRRGISLEDIL